MDLLTGQHTAGLFSKTAYETARWGLTIAGMSAKSIDLRFLKVFVTASRLWPFAYGIGAIGDIYYTTERSMVLTDPALNSQRVGQENKSWNPAVRLGNLAGHFIGDWLYGGNDRPQRVVTPHPWSELTTEELDRAELQREIDKIEAALDDLNEQERDSHARLEERINEILKDIRNSGSPLEKAVQSARLGKLFAQTPNGADVDLLAKDPENYWKLLFLFYTHGDETRSERVCYCTYPYSDRCGTETNRLLERSEHAVGEYSSHIIPARNKPEKGSSRIQRSKRKAHLH